MESPNAIIPNIYIVPIEQATLDIFPKVHCSCFFIAEHTTQTLLIHAIALHVLQIGCRDFHFIGRQKEQWHLLFDAADIAFQSDCTTESISLTKGYNSIAEFTEQINFIYSFCNCYLIYDDTFLLEKVKRIMNEFGML